MNFDLLNRRSAERFAELLDEPGGERVDEPLAELVAVGHGLAASRPAVHVDAEFRVGLRAMLLAKAERDGIGETAVEPEPSTAAAQPGRIGGSSRRIRARTAIVIGVAAGAMAVSGISAASENASPGDALYGVKRSTERAQLAMAGSDITRGQLSLDFARTRLAEAAALPRDSTTFGGVLDDMDADTRQGVRLLTGSAVTKSDPAPLNSVDTFVDGQRPAFTPVLDRLSSANLERARASMTLLDAVRRRVESLRAGLACGATTRTSADELGPQLAGCAADDTPRGTSVRTPGTGSKGGAKPDSAGTAETRPERTDPAIAPGVAPGPTGDPVPAQATTAPGATPTTATTGTPAPSTSSVPPDKGLLGGLLGGILGG